MSRPLRIILAVLSLLVGVAGVFLPILQAWFFFGIGLVLLAPDIPMFQKWIGKIEQRYPRLGGRLRRFQEKIAKPREKPPQGEGLC